VQKELFFSHKVVSYDTKTSFDSIQEAQGQICSHTTTLRQVKRLSLICGTEVEVPINRNSHIQTLQIRKYSE
jgi:hypothetical protein